MRTCSPAVVAANAHLSGVDVNVDGDGYLGWYMSSNVPGWTVEVRDYGVGKPQRVIIGKAPRVRKNASNDKTAC